MKYSEIEMSGALFIRIADLKKGKDTGAIPLYQYSNPDWYFSVSAKYGTILRTGPGIHIKNSEKFFKEGLIVVG